MKTPSAAERRDGSLERNDARPADQFGKEEAPEAASQGDEAASRLQGTEDLRVGNGQETDQPQAFTIASQFSAISCGVQTPCASSLNLPDVSMTLNA